MAAGSSEKRGTLSPTRAAVALILSRGSMRSPLSKFLRYRDSLRLRKGCKQGSRYEDIQPRSEPGTEKKFAIWWKNAKVESGEHQSSMRKEGRKEGRQVGRQAGRNRFIKCANGAPAYKLCIRGEC